MAARGGALYGRMTAPGESPGAWQSNASGNSNLSATIVIGSSPSEKTEIDFFEMVSFNAVPSDAQKDALVTNMLAHYG